MISLELNDKRELKLLAQDRVNVGDNKFSSISISLPETIEEHNSAECELTLCALLENGNFFEYPFEGNTIYVTNDLTETSQKIKLFIKITKDNNIIGTSSVTELKVTNSPEKRKKLYPRGELDDIIARLETESALKTEEISSLELEKTEKDSQITSLNAQISELSENNAALCSQINEKNSEISTKNSTIYNLSQQIASSRFQTKTVSPQNAAQLVSPDDRYLGLSAVMVNAASSNVDNNIIPENIRRGISILGVTGTFSALPTEPFGGIYFSVPNQNGHPTKCRIHNLMPNNGTLSQGIFNDNKFSALEEVEFLDNDGITDIGNNAFNNMPYLTTVRLHEGLTSIGRNAFNYCTALNDINIPNTVTLIRDSAFFYCLSLQSISLPQGLIQIEGSAFYSCDLRTLEIPNTVTYIGYSSFMNNTNLQLVILPNSILTLSGAIFSYCSALTVLDLSSLDHVPTLNGDMLSGTNSALQIIVADNTMKTAFSQATNWSAYASKYITMEDYENGNN